MMNFEDDAKINISNNNLDEVSQLCQELSNLENDIKSYEDTVKELKKKADKLSMEVIPEKMNELGLKSVELNDGSKLKIAEFVQARITEENKEQAFSWLRDNGHGDLIKHNLSANFGRGEDDKAQDFKKRAEDIGLDLVEKEWVEPMTLKAFAKEQVAQGTGIPMDTFGVFIGNKTKITKT